MITEYLSSYLCLLQLLSSVFYNFNVNIFTSLDKFSPRYFILYDESVNGIVFFYFFSFFLISDIHMLPILNPPPSPLPIPSPWAFPVHQPQASSIVHWTWTGISFHTCHFTCFNAILPNLSTLSLSHRVRKTVLYISVSFAVSYTGLLLPSF